VESPVPKEPAEKEEPVAKGLAAGAELEEPKPPEKLKPGWLPPPKEKGVELAWLDCVGVELAPGKL
jgi:hypothetical protein